MGGGVLLVVLAVLWAVVLIPMLLTRHDTTDETKQVDRFHRAMTMLSRGQADVDPLRLRRNQALRSAAARRRRVTFGLLGLVGSVLVISVMGYAPVWLTVLPTLVLFAWLGLAMRAAMVLPKQMRVPAAVEERPVVATPRPRYVPQQQAAAVEVLAADEFIEEDLAATGTDSAAWHPVPIPTPRNVRASGVPGDVIARASSWSRAVLRDARSKTSAPDADDWGVGRYVPASYAAYDDRDASPVEVFSKSDPGPIAAPAQSTPAPSARPVLRFDEDPPTAELPIIRVAGA